MGPRSPASRADGSAAPSFDGTLVYREGKGANVVDVDGNRFVDLAAGFGSLLLGHQPARVLAAVSEQSQRLAQALGDLHPSDVKIALLERVARVALGAQGQVILAQSGADAVSAALKTALLYTGKPGVIAFRGAYHGLSYGPLALCGLRQSYRAPFAPQLNPHVRFAAYPSEPSELKPLSDWLRAELARGDVGAVVFEPILGRGGCVVPPDAFGPLLGELCAEVGALLVADEIWTGLGRSGEWLFSRARGARPDLVCLGKGLGGVLPLSACVGSERVMAAWSRDEEVVHTATFAGAPLACAASLATLEEIEARGLVERAKRVGSALARELDAVSLRGRSAAASRGVRGAGLMLAIDLGTAPGLALRLKQRLLERGYIVSLGGGGRESVVLTPPLDVPESLLQEFVRELADALPELSP